MKNLIVDLHCHSQMKAYAHSFKPQGPTYHNSSNEWHKNSVWWRDWPTAQDLRKNVHGLFGLTHFTQSDVLTCLQGNVQVVFSSLYPLERGFTYPFNSKGWIADMLVNCITQFGKPRIDFVQSTQGYFSDLENEYRFQTAHAGKIKEIDGKKYRYQFVNSYEELECLLTQNDGGIQDLAVINSIEGAHSFGTGLSPYKLSEPLNNVLANILKVKTVWEYPPFFVTLAHHFYNEICGHAKSLGIAGVLVKQKHGLNTGFTPAGKRILNLLLDDTIGRRILIDIKHMSLQARKEYYNILSDQYGFSVPIMVSHGCVTGYHDRTGRKRIRSAITGSPHKKFCTHDINFYDVEIINIKLTGGIFGIQLAEKRIASGAEKRKVKKTDPRNRLKLSAKLVWNQIQHIAEVLDHQGHFAWGIQSLGSDFDGIIDPIDGFFTALHFDNLSQFLLQHAQRYVNREMPDRIRHDFNRIDAEEMIDRFLRKNALDFLRKHFKAQVPSAPRNVLSPSVLMNES